MLLFICDYSDHYTSDIIENSEFGQQNSYMYIVQLPCMAVTTTNNSKVALLRIKIEYIPSPTPPIYRKLSHTHLLWFLGRLHTGHHAPQMPQVPHTGAMASDERGPGNIGTVSRHEEAFGGELGRFCERMLSYHLLLLLLELRGGHVDTSCIVERKSG